MARSGFFARLAKGIARLAALGALSFYAVSQPANFDYVSSQPPRDLARVGRSDLEARAMGNSPATQRGPRSSKTTDKQAREPGILNIDAGAGRIVHGKELTYHAHNKDYRVRIMGFDDYSSINSVEQALELVARDNSPSVLVVGDFSEDQYQTIASILRRMDEINPRLISELEPVIVSLRGGGGGVEYTNAFYKPEEFPDVLLRYCNRQTYESIVGEEGYGKRVSRTVGKHVRIPTSEEDAKAIIDEIRAYMLEKRRKDGYDLIAISAGLHYELDRVLAHEFGHAIFGEKEDGLAIHRETAQSDRSIWSEYALKREKEVRSWVRKKKEKLEELIEIHKSCSESEQQELARGASQPAASESAECRVCIGLRNLGEERLEELYSQILDEAAVEWMTTDQIADTVADIVGWRGEWDIARSKYNDAIESLRTAEFLLKSLADMNLRLSKTDEEKKKFLEKKRRYQEEIARRKKELKKFKIIEDIRSYMEHFGE